MRITGSRSLIADMISREVAYRERGRNERSKNGATSTRARGFANKQDQRRGRRAKGDNAAQKGLCETREARSRYGIGSAFRVNISVMSWYPPIVDFNLPTVTFVRSADQKHRDEQSTQCCFSTGACANNLRINANLQTIHAVSVAPARALSSDTFVRIVGLINGIPSKPAN